MKANTHTKINLKRVYILIAAIIFVLGFMFFSKVISEEKLQDNVITAYDNNWYYIKDKEEIQISLPFKIELKDEESFTIYNNDIAPNHAGKKILVKNAIYRPEIYLDDIPLYQYTDGGLRRNPPELSYQLCIGKIRDDVKTGTVKIVYHKSNDNIMFLPEVYVSSADAIVKDLFLSNAYITVITIMLIMLGILVLLVGVITRKQNYAYKQKLRMLGLFLFTIGFWCATDSPLVQYLLGYSNVNMYLDFFVLMFLMVPFIGYIKCVKGMDKYKSLNYILLLGLCNIIIQTVLSLLNIYTFIMMVPATHIMIVVAVAASIFLLYKEYIIDNNREVFLCLRAFVIAGAFSVFSIVMYFLKPELFYQNTLQTGLLLFMLVLLWNIVSEFIESLKYKTEANIYKQLAEIDKLTNLKNRRGFDLKIAEIENNIDAYDNVLLIFIDVNGLKIINDSYGHTRGDETIMAVANCIESAYKNHGFCYRIGGDEFCAIIENPLFSEQDAISFAEHEVKNYNNKLEEECCFSIAIGCSFLKECGGKVKEITAWKEEADHKMYKDKKKKGEEKAQYEKAH